MDHSLILRTDIDLGAMDRWIMESLFGRGEGVRDYRSTAKDHWSIAEVLGQRLAWEQRIIGPLCYFSIFVKILPGSMDHWIIGANWNYLHITSLYCNRGRSFETFNLPWSYCEYLDDVLYAKTGKCSFARIIFLAEGRL